MAPTTKGKMKPLKNIKGLLVAIILFAIGMVRLEGATSVTVSVAAGDYMPLGWNFQNKTVSAAFPGSYPGTILHFWNIGTQSYNTVTYDSEFGEWTNGGYVITNGLGFLWQNLNTSSVNVTLSGTLVTNSSVSFNFTSGNYYLLADPYFRYDSWSYWLECVYDESAGFNRYTSESIGASPGDGDEIWCRGPWGELLIRGRRVDGCVLESDPLWENPTYPNTCSNAYGYALSPPMRAGRGFWYLPAANRSWTIPATIVDCTP